MALFQEKKRADMKMKRKVIVKHALALWGIMLGMESQGLSLISPTRARIVEIQQAIQIYRMVNNGKFPDSLDELAQPIRDDAEPLLKKEDLLDSWGDPFEYLLDGHQYIIRSSGPDKKMGTVDDIFDGYPKSYVESWQAKHDQTVAEQETNTVQGVTAGTGQSPAGTKKVTPSRVPVTNRQHTYERLEPTPPWKILLRVGVIVVGVMAVWRCFRKGKQESGIKAAIRFILECVAVFLAIIWLYIIVVGAYYTWAHKRKHPHPSTTRINAQMTDIRLAIDIYWGKHDLKYPASLDELAQFAYNHMSLGKPLLKEGDLIDRWGEPFAYETDGEGWYIIRSSGPDKVMGTADDIFRGEPQKYVDEAIQKARLTPAVVRPETNAVQEATAGAVQSPAGTQKVTPSRIPVTGTQPSSEPDETKNTPWQLLLLIGIIAISTIMAWRYFRKKEK